MGDLRGFQVKQMHSFDTKNPFSVERRRLKRTKIPDYRKISHYYKSTEQYWKERNRRKQVLKLTHDGLTMQQIAKELGVSYRTVRRDMVKLEPYIKGQFNKHLRQLQREAREQLEQELKSLGAFDMEKRFQMITKLMCKTRKLSKQEQFMQHNNIILVNMDKLNPQGLPVIDLAFKNAAFKTPYTLSLVIIKDNEKHSIGGLRIGA